MFIKIIKDYIQKKKYTNLFFSEAKVFEQLVEKIDIFDDDDYNFLISYDPKLKKIDRDRLYYKIFSKGNKYTFDILNNHYKRVDLLEKRKKAKIWYDKSFDSAYSYILIDFKDYSVKYNSKTVRIPTATVLGIDLEGIKEIITIYIGPAYQVNDFYSETLYNIRARGIKDVKVMIAIESMKFEEAFYEIYKNSDYQSALFTQIHFALKDISNSKKDKLLKDLNYVYTATSESAGLNVLKKLKEVQDKELIDIYDFLTLHWPKLENFFRYSQNDRQRMYFCILDTITLRKELRKRLPDQQFPSFRTFLNKLKLEMYDISTKWSFL